MHAKLLQSCSTLCDPMDCSSVGSSVHGIPQARILEWVAMPTSRGSSRPRDRTQVCCTGGQLLYHSTTAKSLQLCPTLCHPLDCSPPGSSVHGISQARILEWVAMPSSKGSSPPRNQTCVSCLQHWQAGSLPLVPPAEKAVAPTPVLLPGKSHGRRGLVGCSPWGR